MTEQDWLDAGMPFGVPFTLIREVYHKHYEEPILAGVRAIHLAIEQYQGKHNTLYLHTTNVGEPCPNPYNNPIYMAPSAARPNILRIGATVVIQRRTNATNR